MNGIAGKGHATLAALVTWTSEAYVRYTPPNRWIWKVTGGWPSGCPRKTRHVLAGRQRNDGKSDRRLAALCGLPQRWLP